MVFLQETGQLSERPGYIKAKHQTNKLPRKGKTKQFERCPAGQVTSQFVLALVLVAPDFALRRVFRSHDSTRVKDVVGEGGVTVLSQYPEH